MIERLTAHHHLRASAAIGMAQGVFVFNEYVARRELGASRAHLVALLLAPALAQMLAVVWNPADPGRPLSRRPFRVLGVGLHLPLLLLAPLVLLGLGVGATGFVVLLALAAVGHALLVPTQGAILSQNYPAARRSRRFSRAVAVQAMGLVAVSLPLGWLLDHHRAVWSWAYGGAALAAGVGYARWGRLRRRRPPPPPPHLVSHASPFRVLRHDRRFLLFEVAFMVYGIGFLALQPVLPLYLLDELHVGYAQVGLARGAVFWIALIVAAPLAGWLGDRLGVLRLGALGFAVLALFPATLLLVGSIEGVYAAFAVFGVAMSCVNVAWNLGPIALAGERDPLPYLNAHIGLIGIRAVIGMVGGTALQAAHGSRVVFGGVIGLEIVAAIVMAWTARASGRRWFVRGRRFQDVAAPAPDVTLPSAP